MKSIIEYINNYFESKEEKLFESFKSSIINEINDYVNNQIKKENEENKKIEDEAKKKGETTYSWMFNHHNYSPLRAFIKDVNISWDKLEDGDFDVYTDIEEAEKQVKRMASNRSTHFNGVVIPEYKETMAGPKYRRILYTTYWGDLTYISLISNYGCRFGSGRLLKPSEVEDFIDKAEKVYILNLSNHKDLSTNELKNNRGKSKSGVVYNTQEYYNKIAKENKDRYERLAAQLKQKKYADDGISEKINSYVNKILKVSEKFSKDPIKYSKFEYDLKNLLENNYKLISLYKEYLDAKLSNASGSGYSWDRKNFETTKKSISDLCKKIDDLLEKLEDKINATK